MGFVEEGVTHFASLAQTPPPCHRSHLLMLTLTVSVKLCALHSSAKVLTSCDILQTLQPYEDDLQIFACKLLRAFQKPPQKNPAASEC